MTKLFNLIKMKGKAWLPIAKRTACSFIHKHSREYVVHYVEDGNIKHCLDKMSWLSGIIGDVL
jgi:tetrahydromethanopterin S-methyltransferase subunit D